MSSPQHAGIKDQDEVSSVHHDSVENQSLPISTLKEGFSPSQYYEINVMDRLV